MIRRCCLSKLMANFLSDVDYLDKATTLRTFKVLASWSPNELQESSWSSDPPILSVILFHVSLQPILLMSWRSWSCQRTWRACRWRQDYAPAGRNERRRTSPTRSIRRFNWARPPSNSSLVCFHLNICGLLWYSLYYKVTLWMYFFHWVPLV